MCCTDAGASTAARIVGARSISDGGCRSNASAATRGPAATITPSMRWSPDTQSASSSALLAWVSEYSGAGSKIRSGAESRNLPLNSSSRRHTFLTGERPVAGSTNDPIFAATSSRTLS